MKILVLICAVLIVGCRQPEPKLANAKTIAEAASKVHEEVGQMKLIIKSGLKELMDLDAFVERPTWTKEEAAKARNAIYNTVRKLAEGEVAVEFLEMKLEWLKNQAQLHENKDK